MKILCIQTKNTHDVEFRSYSGNETLRCPECSHNRKAHNKTSKPFSWNHNDRVGKCHNCDCSFVVPREIKIKKDYQKPVWINKTEVSSDLVRFFEGRRISQSTINELKITSSVDWMPKAQKEIPTIHFNYFRNNELVNIKYRGKDKDFKLHKDAELILYNLDSIKDSKFAVIVEGEMDCASFVECGIKPCVSVPNGAKNYEFLDNCFEDLERLETVYISSDNDEPGIALRNELIRRIGSDRCRLINLGNRKDANECLMFDGKEALINAFNTALEIPVSGIITTSDVEEEMLYSFRNGKKHGTTTHLGILDNHWKWRNGEVTIWTGYNNEGKSCFLTQLMVLKAKLDNFRFAVFTPENYPVSEYYDEVIHCWTGQSTDKSYRNVLSEEDYKIAIQEVGECFFTINPEDEEYTIDTILSKAKYLIRKKGVNSLIIDPYNQIEHILQPGQREDLYISKFMSRLKRFAIDNDISIHLVAHQTTPQVYGTDNYQKPDIYKIKGGGTFSDKADNVISIWRPNRRTDPRDTSVTVIVGKIKKQKLVGLPGEVNVFYDFMKNRYYFDTDTEVDFMIREGYSEIKSHIQNNYEPLHKTNIEDIIENTSADDFFFDKVDNKDAPF